LYRLALGSLYFSGYLLSLSSAEKKEDRRVPYRFLRIFVQLTGTLKGLSRRVSIWLARQSRQVS